MVEESLLSGFLLIGVEVFDSGLRLWASADRDLQGESKDVIGDASSFKRPVNSEAEAGDTAAAAGDITAARLCGAAAAVGDTAAATVTAVGESREAEWIFESLTVDRDSG